MITVEVAVTSGELPEDGELVTYRKRSARIIDETIQFDIAQADASDFDLGDPPRSVEVMIVSGELVTGDGGPVPGRNLGSGPPV